MINYFGIFINSVGAREDLRKGLLQLQPWEPVEALPRSVRWEHAGQDPSIAWGMILWTRKFVVLSTGI